MCQPKLPYLFMPTRIPDLISSSSNTNFSIASYILHLYLPCLFMPSQETKLHSSSSSTSTFPLWTIFTPSSHQPLHEHYLQDPPKQPTAFQVRTLDPRTHDPTPPLRHYSRKLSPTSKFFTISARMYQPKLSYVLMSPQEIYITH